MQFKWHEKRKSVPRAGSNKEGEIEIECERKDGSFLAPLCCVIYINSVEFNLRSGTNVFNVAFCFTLSPFYLSPSLFISLSLSHSLDRALLAHILTYADSVRARVLVKQTARCGFAYFSHSIVGTDISDDDRVLARTVNVDGRKISHR